MVFEVASAGIGAVGGAVATVASSKVYAWVKTKVVAWAVAEATKVIADAKKV
jgi:hypothetical protein